jgi:hypothetical protein
MLRNPRNRAVNKLGEALDRDVMNPERMAANLRKMGPDSTMADAGGENVLSLADATVQTPGKTRNQAISMLNSRQLGKTGRTMDALSDSIGDEKNFYTVLDNITASLKNKSSPLYREAFDSNQDMSSKLIDRILDTPAGVKALQGARVRMQNKMALMAKPDADLTEQMRFLASIDKMDKVPVGVSQGLKLRTLDFVKQEMDDMISSLEKQVRSGTARRGEVTDLRNLKNSMLKEMDDLDATGGKYSDARKVYAGDARNKQALENGRNFLKDDAEITEKLLSSMSDAERENFRAGAMRAIRDKIESSPEGADVYKRIFGNETIKKKLRTLFPDSRTYANFARKIKTEAQFHKTRAKVTGGSATLNRAMNEVDIGVNPNETSGAVLSWRYALARALMKRLQGRAGITAPVRDELGGILFNKSPSENQKIIAELLKKSSAQIPQSQGSITGSLLGKTTAMSSSRGGRE